MHFILFILSERNFYDMCFISVYSVLNTLSEYAYFLILKNITSHTCLPVFKTFGRLPWWWGTWTKTLQNIYEFTLRNNYYHGPSTSKSQITNFIKELVFPKNFASMKTLFNSFLKSYIKYGNLDWVGAPKTEKIEFIN